MDLQSKSFITRKDVILTGAGITTTVHPGVVDHYEFRMISMRVSKSAKNWARMMTCAKQTCTKLERKTDSFSLQNYEKSIQYFKETLHNVCMFLYFKTTITSQEFSEILEVEEKLRITEQTFGIAR